jgi:hypothetical protein
MDVLKNEIVKQLRDHPGFPTGDQVGCHIFLRDKMGYIEKAPHFFLPSLKLNLTEFMSNDVATLNEIFHFLNRYPDSQFVVKTGYTRNDSYKSIKCSNQNEVYKKLALLCEKHIHKGNNELKFNYAFIQKIVSNRKEHKLLFFDGKFQYVQQVSAHARDKRALYHSSEDIQLFAQSVVDYYKIFVPEVISQGIIRVDVMEDDEGNLLVLDHPVVNEYYEYALKERILENLFLNGENTSQKLQLIQGKLRPARTNALSFINTPDFGELKRVWEKNRKAMYAKYYNMFNSYAWYGGFKTVRGPYENY